MKRLKYIVFLTLFFPTLMEGQEVCKAEKRQQFLYYFYEADRLIQTDHADEAWELVQFCYELDSSNATINNFMGCYMEVFQQPEAAQYFFMRAYQQDASHYWYRYITLLLQSQDKAQRLVAIEELNKVAKLLPKDEHVMEMLQKAYILDEQYKQALIVQDRLDSIIGYTPESAVQRYRIYMVLRDTKNALNEVEKYLETDADNYQFQVFRLQLYEQIGQKREKLVKAYQDILRLNPRNTMVMNNLAWNLCLMKQDLNKAEQLSRMTIMAEPSNAIFLDTYAWILYTMGDYENAFFYITRAKQHAQDEQLEEVEKHYQSILKKQKKKK